MSTETSATSACTTLDTQLCFALHDASRAISASYRRGLAPLGLTYSQYVVLLVLWEHGPTTMGTLCRELHLDSGTLSPLLQRLEERGRVVRRRRPEDERTVEVTCTAEGEAPGSRCSPSSAGCRPTRGWASRTSSGSVPSSRPSPTGCAPPTRAASPAGTSRLPPWRSPRRRRSMSTA